MNEQQLNWFRQAGVLSESTQTQSILMEGVEFDPFLLEGILDKPKEFLKKVKSKVNKVKELKLFMKKVKGLSEKQKNDFKAQAAKIVTDNKNAIKRVVKDPLPFLLSITGVPAIVATIAVEVPLAIGLVSALLLEKFGLIETSTVDVMKAFTEGTAVPGMFLVLILLGISLLTVGAIVTVRNPQKDRSI